MNKFRQITQALKAEVGFPVNRPIAIDDSNPANDLRYGSERLARDSYAYPSWYGLHGSWNGALVLTPQGQTVSHAALFATQPWVRATVMRYLSWLELVPVKVYRRTDDDSRIRLRAKDHPLVKAIEQPWRGGGSSDLMSAILLPLLVHGNATLQVESGPGESMRFIPRDWRNMAPTQVAAHYVSGWTFEDDAFDESRTFTADEILHVAWGSPYGPLGVSPLTALGTTLSSELAAQMYGINNFRNGARPPSAIKADAEFFGGLEQAERDAILADFREQITARYSGVENSGVPAILPPGMDWVGIGHNAQEAVLIEQRKLNREEVEGVYLMPPPLVGQLDNATYSNIETQHTMGYQDTLGPQTVKIANAINSQIVRDLLGEDDIYVELDPNGVLRGDPLTQSQNLSVLFQNGVITRNEWRAIINRDRIPAEDDPTADQFFVQANNMRPAQSLDDPNSSADSGQ